jgi:hypothetical protein
MAMTASKSSSVMAAKVAASRTACAITVRWELEGMV